MIQCGQQLGLAFKAHESIDIGGERLRKDLDRHLSIERGVDGLPDNAHSPLAKFVEQAVVQQVLARN